MKQNVLLYILIIALIGFGVLLLNQFDLLGWAPTFVGSVIVFLLVRELLTWYWKLNKITDQLDEIISELKSLKR